MGHIGLQATRDIAATICVSYGYGLDRVDDRDVRHIWATASSNSLEATKTRSWTGKAKHPNIDRIYRRDVIVDAVVELLEVM